MERGPGRQVSQARQAWQRQALQASPQREGRAWPWQRPGLRVLPRRQLVVFRQPVPLAYPRPQADQEF